MRLLLLHPVVAARSCDVCEQWLFNEDGSPTMRGPAHVRRPLGVLTPCVTCPKIPIFVPPEQKSRRKAIELSDRNRTAWWHFRECKAVGHWPDDPIVRRNAVVIGDVVNGVAEARQDRLHQLLATGLGMR